MRSEAKTAVEYLNSLPEDRVVPMDKLYKAIKKNLPKGFSEGMGYGALGWSVPHSLYPPGYHCDPAQPAFYGYRLTKTFYCSIPYGHLQRSSIAEMVYRPIPGALQAQAGYG